MYTGFMFWMSTQEQQIKMFQGPVIKVTYVIKSNVVGL